MSSNKILDYTHKIQLQRQDLFKHNIETQYFKSCVNCTNWKHDGINEVCSLNKLHPPAEIIVYGCELHDFDIPF